MTTADTQEDRGPETVGFRRRQAKRERAQAVVAGQPLLAGIDLGQKRHAAFTIDRDLVPIDRFFFPHSWEGLEKFLERARRPLAVGRFDRLVVFMETTGHLWQVVANLLEARGIEYHTVAPVSVGRQREIEHLTYAKSDYRDAELIAGLGARGNWLHRTLHREPLWLRLHALALEHESILELELAERLRVRSLLGLALPEFLDCFKDPTKKTARRILKKLSRPAAEIPQNYGALVERVTETFGRSSKVRRLVARLDLGQVIGVERALGPALARLGRAVDRYELLSGQRDDIRAQLVRLYEATPYRAVLDTIPGVSPESHALVLGFVGDPKQYDRATCLTKLAGTEPRDNASGNAEGRHSIARRGSPQLRHIAHRIVMGLMLNNDEFAAHLRRLQQRAKDPLAYHQAAVATANKYLRVFYHVCVSGKPYDASKLGPRT